LRDSEILEHILITYAGLELVLKILMELCGISSRHSRTWRGLSYTSVKNTLRSSRHRNVKRRTLYFADCRFLCEAESSGCV